MKVQYPEFGDWLRTHREATGKSQRKLADEAPVSYGAIGQYETGRALPRLNRVEGLARAYEVEEQELVEQLLQATRDKRWFVVQAADLRNHLHVTLRRPAFGAVA